MRDPPIDPPILDWYDQDEETDRCPEDEYIHLDALRREDLDHFPQDLDTGYSGWVPASDTHTEDTHTEIMNYLITCIRCKNAETWTAADFTAMKRPWHCTMNISTVPMMHVACNSEAYTKVTHHPKSDTHA